MMLRNAGGKFVKGGIYNHQHQQRRINDDIATTTRRRRRTSWLKVPQSLATATLLSLRASASTTALTKCVVPMATLRIWAGSMPDLLRTLSTTLLMPLVTSGVVGVLLEARTPREGVSLAVISRMAASVLVPPTSTPMRYILTSAEAKGQQQQQQQNERQAAAATS